MFNLKILLDECIDRRFAQSLPGHLVKTVPQMGWATIKNGRLLTLAEKEFDFFITVDRSLSSQQNLGKYNIAVLVLESQSNRLDDLIPFAPKILKALSTLKKGQATRIKFSD